MKSGFYHRLTVRILFAPAFSPGPIASAIRPGQEHDVINPHVSKMKTTLKVFASALTLLVACLAQASDSKAVARVISITDIETDDASGYATWIAKYNEVVKAKLGIDTYLHIYVSNNDGERSGSVRSVVSAESVAAMTKNNAALADDPALRDIRDHMRGLRKQGARVLYQGVRYDGGHKGAYVYTTLALVNDEAGYLKALDGLRVLFDKNGFQDSKINAYRVLAGRTNFSHRITLSLPSNERLAALLDFVSADPSMAEWLASAAKYRTVVSNLTGHDITK